MRAILAIRSTKGLHWLPIRHNVIWWPFLFTFVQPNVLICKGLSINNISIIWAIPDIPPPCWLKLVWIPDYLSAIFLLLFPATNFSVYCVDNQIISLAANSFSNATKLFCSDRCCLFWQLFWVSTFFSTAAENHICGQKLTLP